MIINHKNKTMDMEVRDINYILPAYVRSYLFHMKNEMPEKIIFPMFPSVKAGDKVIPIEYVPYLDTVATAIAEDGKDVAEVTPAEEAVLDEKDEEIKRLKAEVAGLAQTGRGEVGRGSVSEHTSNSPDFTSEQLLDEAADKKLEEDTADEEPKTLADEMPNEEPEETTPSPAKAAFAESAGKSIDKAEKERYEAKDERMQKMVTAITEPIVVTTTPEMKAVEEAGNIFPKPYEPLTVVDIPPKGTPPLPDREPKQPPGGAIPPGSSLSDMGARDQSDQVRTARDLLDEPNVNEAEEKDFGKDVSRGKDGKPVVENKPDVAS